MQRRLYFFIAAFLQLIVSHQLIAKETKVKVSVMLSDTGILLDSPYVEDFFSDKLSTTDKQDSEKYRADILDRYENAPKPEDKAILIGKAFHGTWVARELLRGIDPAGVSLNTVNNIEVQARAGDIAPPPAKPYTRAELEQNAKSNVAETERVIGNVSPPPELYISSMVPQLRGATGADREFERQLYTKLFSQLLAKYPRTLFVLGSTNEGCHISDTQFNYAWSGLTNENLAVIGSCDEAGKRASYSCYGPSVNEDYCGTIRISTSEVFGRRSSSRLSTTIDGTSFSTPRFAHALLAERVQNAAEYPDKKILDYYLESKRSIPIQTPSATGRPLLGNRLLEAH